MNFLSYLKTKGQLLLWLTLGAVVMTYFVCDSCLHSINIYIVVSLYISSIWITMWLGNEYITHRLDEQIPWTQKPLMRFVVGVTAVVLYSAFMGFSLTKLFEFAFNFRVGNSIYQIYTTVTIAVVITLFMTSRSFLMNWKQSAIDAEKLQKESIAAKYESLKNQVNPHFLFNSFNALSNLVYEDQDKAVKFIKQLSEVYRYVLDTREREIVSLEEELKFLESYSYLQKIRFGDKLNMEISLTSKTTMIAPLALQILIENAIKHNVISEEDPLFVKLYFEGEYVVVKNNLQKKTSLGEPSTGVGLENICKRYEFLSDRKVVVDQNEKEFIVKLPLLNAKSR